MAENLNKENFLKEVFDYENNKEWNRPIGNKTKTVKIRCRSIKSLIFLFENQFFQIVVLCSGNS